MAYELKEYLKAINESKEDLMKSDETGQRNIQRI